MAMRFVFGPLLAGVGLVAGFKALDTGSASAPQAKAKQAVVNSLAPEVSPGSLRNVMAQPGLQPGSAVQAPPALPTIGPQAATPLRPEPGPPASQAQATGLSSAATKKVAKAEPRGAAGCATYKSFNPVTQTYRSFDGTTRPCRTTITTAAN